MYYPIDENLARRSHEMMSMSDYREGSATAGYRAAVDDAAALVEQRKQKVSPFYHEKLDDLLDRYARRLAQWTNDHNRNGASCPSVLVCGPANFPTRKKAKQNAREDHKEEVHSMTNEKLLYADYQKVLFDEFGNLRHAHMIARYHKNGSGQWQEEKRYTTDGGSAFVIDGKIYFQCNDYLIPMNMDFDSPTCGACEQVIGEIHILHTISKSEFLGCGPDPFFRLCKHSYSDGTVFYSLQDSSGHFSLRYGNRYPHALAASLRCDANKKFRSPQETEILLRFSAILDGEPDAIPDPTKNEVTLSYLTDANPLGCPEEKIFPDLQSAVEWAKRNVPRDSAGWSVYSSPVIGKVPMILYDYRRTT